MNGREPAPVPADPLLAALERRGTGDEAETAARIRAAQEEVASSPVDQLLLVQGGAGTGTTVVGVRRVSWLLHSHPDRFRDNSVLVVGPTPSFVRHLSSVMPSTGDDVVVQVPRSALGPRVRVGRTDPPEVSRLKGDLRMLRVIQRALRHRQRITAGPVELTIDGHRVRLDGERIAHRARQLARGPHNEAHRELRTVLLAEVEESLGEGRSDVPARALAADGASVHAVDDYLDRAWPDLTPQSFLIGLLANPRQLAAAAAGSLSDDEIRLLSIPPDARVVSWHWSIDDVALLDAADELLNGPPATYEHVVVHEAQDLSPLQLESIRRRSRTGGMTVLGDLAQGTGAWAHSSWDDVVGLLAHDGVPIVTAKLQLGYRLPSEVAEVAAGLLSVIAPGVQPPRALRLSGHDVQLVGTTGPELAGAVAATVRSLLGTDSIAVIAPDGERPAVIDALDDIRIGWSHELGTEGGAVVVSSPAGSRGLEFESVVVVEPAEILGERPHGERALYVALTRCTDRLAIVHDRPLPDAIDRRRTDGLRGPEPTPVRSAPPPDRGMEETRDRSQAGAIGDDAPTAAVPVVARGETQVPGGRAGEEMSDDATAIEDQMSGGRQFEDGTGASRYGDGRYGDDRYGEGRYGEDRYGEGRYGEDRYGEDRYGEDRYGDDRYGDDRYGDDRYGEGGYRVDRSDDAGAGDAPAVGAEAEHQGGSSRNGLSGWGPEPPGWRRPVEARRYDSGATVPSWAGPEPGSDTPPPIERPPRFEPPPGVEGRPPVGSPPGAEQPMHFPPSGPATTHQAIPEPDAEPAAWRPRPPPPNAVAPARTPRRRAPEPRSETAPEPADVPPAAVNAAATPPEPFAELDRAIAHAIARALTDKLARYATAELLPLVADEMVRVIARRTARPAPGGVPGSEPGPRRDLSR